MTRDIKNIQQTQKAIRKINRMAKIISKLIANQIELQSEVINYAKECGDFEEWPMFCPACGALMEIASQGKWQCTVCEWNNIMDYKNDN